MLVFNKTNDPLIRAKEITTLMLLGGEPLGERYIWWNFVSSRKARIEQAKEDWKQGRIILPPADNKELFPCPMISLALRVGRQNRGQFRKNCKWATFPFGNSTNNQ
jgi:hypothetical protein